jgi:exosortase/archaeosortase family protein
MLRVLLPVLALLLFASSASAQDVPALVLIDIDLHWTVPNISGPASDVRFFGSQLWQNGVGYVNEPQQFTNRWGITGTVCGTNCAWIEEHFQNTSPPPTSFLLRTEANSVNGNFIFAIPFGAGPLPALLPGDYDISGSVFFNQPRALDEHFLPNISVAGLYVADSGHQRVTAVPELAIFRSFTKHLGGRRLASLVNPTLQRVTTWGAAKLLRAPYAGDRMFLPSTTLEVQEWCSGLVSMKWLLLVATMLLFVGSAPWPWKLVLIMAAPLIALEVNVLRVAAVGAGLEWLGHASRGAIKEWTGWGAIGLGMAQVVGLGWVMKRRAGRA